MLSQDKIYDVKISIIIPCRNGEKFLPRNLESIKRLKDLKEIEVIVVDNNSNDNSFKILQTYKNYIKIKVIKNPANYGFAKACNMGVSKSKADFVFITNQDMIFPSDFFIKLLKIFRSYKDGAKIIISPAIIFENDGIHYFGAKNHILGFSYTPNISKKLPDKRIIKETKRFSGGALLIKRKHFLSAGGFDVRFFMYYEDTDLSLRFLRKNFKILTTNDPYLIHQKHEWKLSEFTYFLLERNRYLLLSKNYKDLKKNLPFLLVLELILIFQSILIKKFPIKIRIYYDLIRNYELLKKMRQESRMSMELLPNNAFSRNLDAFLLNEYKNNKVFTKLFSLFNYLLNLL